MTWIRETKIPRLPFRESSGHKGTYGRVLIVAGSEGMAGAAGLAGKAALRGGAGLVTVASPCRITPIIASYEPSYLTLPLPEEEGCLAHSAVEKILDQKVDAIALGPGLGQSKGVQEVVREVVRHASCPLVVDADGLNSIVGHTELLRQRAAPTVLSPHPGEFSRLTGRKIGEIQGRREELAATFAAEHNIVLILKGSGSIVTDGKRLAINQTGNPGMATGGTGDVLTGLIAALLGQGMLPFDAARLAVHIHGLAGDIIAAESSQVSLIAHDLVDALPRAWRQFEAQEG